MKNERSNWRTLLNRWISGEADRSDERSLDALAQDDPFLADALEGYRSLPGADHARSVTKLKARLRKRHEEKKRGTVFFLKRIAAVGVVLLGAWWVFRSFGPVETQALVFEQKKETAAEAATIPTATDSTIALDQIAGHFSANESEENVQKASGLSRKEVASAQKSTTTAPVRSLAPTLPQPISQPTKTPADKLLDRDFALATADEISPAAAPTATGPASEEDISKAADTAKSAQPGAPPSVAPTADGAVARKKENAAVGPHIVKGRVTDTNGEPLIGASIAVKGTVQGSTTDIEGMFSVNSPVENPTLVIAYTGYDKQEIQPKGGTFLEIQLLENHSVLSEVAVTGRQSKSNNKASGQSKSFKATKAFEPKGGLKKFEKYVKQNLQMPPAAKAVGVNGEVEIGFTIDNAGRPVDLEIVRSLGHGCDEEAIRVLREGPEWDGQPDVRHSFVFLFK